MTLLVVAGGVGRRAPGGVAGAALDAGAGRQDLGPRRVSAGQRSAVRGVARRDRAGGRQDQRAPGAAPGVVPAREAVHGRRQPRAAHAAGGTAHDPGGRRFAGAGGARLSGRHRAGGRAWCWRCRRSARTCWRWPVWTLGWFPFVRNRSPCARSFKPAGRPFQRAAHERRLTFENEIDAESVVEIDPDQLRIIVSNLLSNAATYTAAGGTIRVRGGLMTGQPDLLLAVHDSGPPIPDDLLAPGVRPIRSRRRDARRPALTAGSVWRWSAASRTRWGSTSSPRTRPTVASASP